jgi:microcystin-dependent protein
MSWSFSPAIARTFAVSAVALVTLAIPSTARAQDAFLGEIRFVSFNFAPPGWASCNGQLLPIAQNTALFALIGTYYGGDGRVTFALPDMRGRLFMHFGAGPGLGPRDLGERGGAESHTLTLSEMPAHTHSLESHTHAIPSVAVDVKGSSAAATSTSPAGGVLANATPGTGGGGGGRGGGPGVATNVYNAGPADVSLAAGSAATAAGTTGGGTGTITPAGGGLPYGTMSPYGALHCIINMNGIFPSRQ